MSIAKRLFDVFRRRKGSPGDKGAVGTANDKRAADKTDFVHGKPAPQPTDSKRSASAKDEKLATESKRSISAKESVDEKVAPGGKRSLAAEESKDPEQVADLAKSPWPAVCHLQINFGGPSSKDGKSGSGFFVSETMIITAAHNLCEVDKRTREFTPAASILIRPSNHKAPITLKCSPLNTRVAKKYEECVKADPSAEIKYQHDYGAILLLPGTIKPEPAFYFEIEGTEPEDAHWGKPMMFGGYSKANSAFSPFELFYTQGAALSKREDRFLGESCNLVKHSAASVRGQSGGPLFALDDNRVVGIQVWELPSEADDLPLYGAVRISRDMVQLFKSWEREYRDSPEFLKNLVA